MPVDIFIVEPHDRFHELVAFGREAQSVFGVAVPAEVDDERVDEVGVVDGLQRVAARGLFFQDADLLRFEQTDALGVFEVAAEVGHLVRQLDDAAFPGVRVKAAVLAELHEVDGFVSRAEALLVHLAAVRDDAVADGVGQVEVLVAAVRGRQPFERVDHAQRVLLVPEFAQFVLLAEGVQHRFAAVSEGRVAEVVAHRDGLGQLGVQPHEAGDGAAYRNHMVDMFDARADAVVVRMEKDLRLRFEAGVGERVQDAAGVAVEFAADFVRLAAVGALARDAGVPMRVPFAHGHPRESVAVTLDGGF